MNSNESMNIDIYMGTFLQVYVYRHNVCRCILYVFVHVAYCCVHVCIYACGHFVHNVGPYGCVCMYSYMANVYCVDAVCRPVSLNK